ncbi:MAG TPA: FGGY-family carbohydrate kinase [Spirochaetota bacterium]|nr:FGGY-family carbohydrate kinase [Spirochaetota bacterium]
MATPGKDRYILAVDHGTSGCKVALSTMHGHILDFESEATPVYFLPAGGAEQSPAEWWNAFMKSSRRLIRRHRDKAGRIDAICVSSTFSSTVAVDRDGNHLMNSITWMDSRGAPYIRSVASGFPSIDGYGLSKVLRWISVTGGGPSLSGKDDIAHVLLTKHEYPCIYEKTYKFLGSKDYFNLKLTGEYAATHDSIMLFWVTDTRDINNIRYSKPLIKAFGIDPDKLPPLVKSIDVIGTVLPEIAREMGLHGGVRVIGGSPDHQSALVGSGAVRDFEGHLYVGTSSWIECAVPFKKTDMFHSIASLPSAIPGRYQCINEQDIAGGALTFLLNNIIFHKSHFYEAKRPRNPYGRLDQTVKRVPAGSNGLIFAPWLNGERTPVDSTTIRGVLYNLSMTTNTDDIIRSVLEGVAYNTRWSMKYTERFIGRAFNTINIIGGGAQSDEWCRIFADVLGRNIRRVRDPIQANARGAALIASVGLSHIRFEDIPELVEYDSTFSPASNNSAKYDALFAEFVNIYKKNRGIFKRLNGQG